LSEKAPQLTKTQLWFANRWHRTK